MQLNREQGEEGSELQLTGEDGMIRKGRLDLERLEKELKRCESNYQKSQKKLYSEKMMGSLNKKYENLKIKEMKKQEQEEAEMDMPELDSDGEEDLEREREEQRNIAEDLNLPPPPSAR